MSDSSETFNTTAVYQSTEYSYDDYNNELFEWVSLPVEEFFNKYGMIIIGSVGLTANITCLAILLSRKFRSQAAFLTLLLLCLADTASVLALVFPHLIGKEVYYEYSETPAWVCTALAYARLVCPYLSSWSLVLVSVERAIHIALPFKAREICTKRRILFAWVLILICCTGLNLPAFWYVYKPEEPSYDLLPFMGGGCVVRSDWLWYIDDVLLVCDILLISLVPLLLLIISSSIIVIKLIKANRQRQEMGGKGNTTNDHRSVTTMLLVTNLFFFLTVTPYYSLSIVIEALGFAPFDTDPLVLRIRVAITVTEILAATNHGINIFLYYLSGSKFRDAASDLFKVMFSCCKDDKLKSSDQSKSSKTEEKQSSSSGVGTPSIIVHVDDKADV